MGTPVNQRLFKISVIVSPDTSDLIKPFNILLSKASGIPVFGMELITAGTFNIINNDVFSGDSKIDRGTMGDIIGNCTTNEGAPVGK